MELALTTRVLLSAEAWRMYGASLRHSIPGLTWLIHGEDGAVTSPGEGTPRLDPNVAWLSTDVFFSAQLPSFIATLRAAPDLTWVQSASSGTDTPLFTELLDHGVRVTNCHVTAIPIAEYVVGSVLRHYQKPEEWQAAATRRTWSRHEFREMCGSTWLVVGLGAIGMSVAQRAAAFNAYVIGVRRSPTGNEPANEVLEPNETRRAVPRADVVVLAAPPGQDTVQLVDREFLASMREGSLVFNVARGSLVDEDALLSALESGVPERAFLDVFSAEPLPEDSPLWGHPRVTVTPHSAGAGLGRYRRAADVFCDNLRRFVDSSPLLNEVSAPSALNVDSSWHVLGRPEGLRNGGPDANDS